MTDMAIKVENLSKAYRLGLQQERAEMLVGALANLAKALLRNFRDPFVVGIRDVQTLISLVRAQGLRCFRVFADRTQWGKLVRPAVSWFRKISGKIAAFSKSSGRAASLAQDSR